MKLRLFSIFIVLTLITTTACSKKKKEDSLDAEAAELEMAATTDAPPAQPNAEGTTSQAQNNTAAPANSSADKPGTTTAQQPASAPSEPPNQTAATTAQPIAPPQDSAQATSSNQNSNTQANLPPPPEPAPVAPVDAPPLAANESTQTQQAIPADSNATDQSRDPATPSGNTRSYSVRRGDTLMKLAFEIYGDLLQWRKIYNMNRDKITDPSRIPAGVRLTLESPPQQIVDSRTGERYEIQRGDTLGKIAQNVYGDRNKWRKIYRHNKAYIKNPNKIFAGFYLYYLPEGTPSRLGKNDSKPNDTPSMSAPTKLKTNQTPEVVVAPKVTALQPGQLAKQQESKSPANREPASQGPQKTETSVSLAPSLRGGESNKAKQ